MSFSTLKLHQIFSISKQSFLKIIINFLFLIPKISLMNFEKSRLIETILHERSTIPKVPVSRFTDGGTGR